MRVEENQGHTVRRGRTTPGLIPKIKRYALPDDFQRGVAIELTEVVLRHGEHALGPSGGVDGVIKQDKLGLDVVCIQAKRWDGPVGRPIIQGFVGSMDYIRARKGVILTTSSFTKDAVDFVERIEGKKVVLINGDQLADLMIDHGL